MHAANSSHVALPRHTLNSLASANLPPSSAAAVASSVTLPPLLPSLLAGRSPDGHDFFGLGLTLTL